ncbi:MAG: hypothetical protein J0H86_08295 [Xanthomonadaceae bacterium]|nr:hypothetical protein [Xanthomonadaceae bacterium]
MDELLRVTASRPITTRTGVARGNANVTSVIADTSSLAGTNDGGDGDVEGDTAQ